MSDWIRRYPIGAFVLWFGTIGQLFAWGPVFATMARMEVPYQPFIVGSTLIGLLLPALVITRITDGPEGLKRMWRSTVDVAQPARWYAFALLVLTVPAVVLALVFYRFPNDTFTDMLSAFVFGFVVQGVITFVTNNWWEEVAVMGFLQVRLQERHGALVGLLLTTLFFTFQHISLIIVSGMAGVLFPFFLITAFGFRAIAGWAYNKIGSLFIVGLAHAAGNAVTGGSGFGGPGLLPRLYENTDTVSLLHLVGAAIVGIALVIATRGRLGSSR